MDQPTDIEPLRAQVRQLRAELHQARRDADRWRDRAKANEELAEHHAEQLRALRKSKSWRMTAPVRIFHRFVGR